ncbi:MAG: serine/threonine protein kinase [Acidobacteria bacterium]|nr:serine/threonine protein kinase [Acidobacteriota bacterium]
MVDGRVFYVMKYVRGGRLDQYIDAQQTLNQRLRLFCTICEAVAFAHAHGVIHRDLKPENIMVGQFGEVLVMDWGIAKVLGETETLGAVSNCAASGGTGHGVVMGTPEYMPPEQVSGQSANADRRADVYALGAILRFLLSSAPQPKRLAAICAKAMSALPEDRYGDAQALGADIDRYLDDRPVAAYRDTALERLARAISRHRFIVLLVLAYILMRVILIFFA